MAERGVVRAVASGEVVGYRPGIDEDFSANIRVPRGTKGVVLRHRDGSHLIRWDRALYLNGTPEPAVLEGADVVSYGGYEATAEIADDIVADTARALDGTLDGPSPQFQVGDRVSDWQDDVGTVVGVGDGELKIQYDDRDIGDAGLVEYVRDEWAGFDNLKLTLLSPARPSATPPPDRPDPRPRFEAGDRVVDEEGDRATVVAVRGRTFDVCWDNRLYGDGGLATDLDDRMVAFRRLDDDEPDDEALDGPADDAADTVRELADAVAAFARNLFDASADLLNLAAAIAGREDEA